MSSSLADPPLLTTSRRVLTETHSSVSLSQIDIERIVLEHYDLPPGTDLIWDISSQGLLRTLTVSHVERSES